MNRLGGQDAERPLVVAVAATKGGRMLETVEAASRTLVEPDVCLFEVTASRLHELGLLESRRRWLDRAEWIEPFTLRERIAELRDKAFFIRPVGKLREKLRSIKGKPSENHDP